MDNKENNNINLILNPLHQEYSNLPKRSMVVPRLNFFNEIVHEIKWYCYPSDLERYMKYKK